MSCIPYLLKLKSDIHNDELKLNSHVMLESGGHYKNYSYCITFNSFGIRCGYVEISADHPLANKKIGDLDFDVHGGITFFDSPTSLVNEKILKKNTCNDIWIGFDAGHLDDGRDIEKVINDFPKYAASMNYTIALLKSENIFNDEDVKSNAYMEAECKNLIDQINDSLK